MREFYNDLLAVAETIEKHWQKVNYATEEFHKVVDQCTKSLDLTPLAEVSAQLELLDHPSVRAIQVRSTFSDFYFQVFNNGRFLVEVLNWWGGQVNVHDHDFSAIQYQLKGESLNVVYDFDDDSTGSKGALTFGTLKVRKAEIWKPGGRSVVRHGSQDPHGVYHLSLPTTSLLIRTLPTARLGAQSNYFSSLRAHYYVQNDLQRKKLTALSLLAGQNGQEFRMHFKKLCRSQSLSENFFMFLKLASYCFRPENIELVHEFAAQGSDEARVIESVAYNNATDFFKTKALKSTKLKESEKLAIFAIAASQSRDGFAKICSDLTKYKSALDIQSSIQSLVSSLQPQEQHMAKAYLGLLRISEGQDASSKN